MFGLGLWRHRHRREGHHHQLASLGTRRRDELGLVGGELTAAGRLDACGYSLVSLDACGYSLGAYSTVAGAAGVPRSEER